MASKWKRWHELSNFKPNPAPNATRKQISRKQPLLRGTVTGTSSQCIAAVSGSLVVPTIVDCKDFLKQLCKALLVVLNGLLITQFKDIRREPCDALPVVLNSLPIMLQIVVLNSLPIILQIVLLNGVLITQLKDIRQDPCDALLVVLNGLLMRRQ